jgi:hypothetical protein
MSDLKPGMVVELGWFPPPGDLYRPNAYAHEVGRKTSLRWYGDDGENYKEWPAQVEAITVLPGGEQVVARLRVLAEEQPPTVQ